MLKISLFDGFEAIRDGKPMPELRLHSARKLLALLALHPNTAIKNDWIAWQIWSSGNSDSLRKAVHQIRLALGPERDRVRAEKNFVRFDLSGVEVDALEFDLAIRQGDESSQTKAVALYKSALLKDWDDAWLVGCRGQREEQHKAAVTKLADSAMARGQLMQAARTLCQGLALYPSQDTWWAKLLAVLIRDDARMEAMEVYRNYLAHLKRANPAPRARLQPAAAIELQMRRLAEPPAPVSPDRTHDLDGYESVGGAVPLASRYYVQRPADAEVSLAVRQQESIVLIKGPRQTGKTSLPARALRQARGDGARVILTDWQKLTVENLQSADAFFLGQAQSIADQLEQAGSPEDYFHSKRGPSASFERFLRDRVLTTPDAAIVWGIDGADRLFSCSFRDNVFGLFRGWHNERALDESSPWNRFTLAMTYATDAHLAIRNLNQSPFDVGCRVTLGDFTPAQVSDLNTRHGNPLGDEDGVSRLYELVGGHPYLVRRTLLEMKKRGMSLDDVDAEAEREGELFIDHLNRLLTSLLVDADLRDHLRALLAGESIPSESLIRLSGAGVLVSRTPGGAQPRCGLYDRFLRRHLV